MGTAELIGIIITSIATILGGVWFIIKQAFKTGENSRRLADIDNRTCNAQCDSHQKDISTLNQDLKDIKNDIVAIKSLLVMKHKNASNIFSMKNSPRTLNENGVKLFADINGKDFLLNNKSFLFSKMDEHKPKTALDVEDAANMVCTTNTDKDIFNGMKSFVYNSPSATIIGDDGKPHTYDITLADVCFVLSLPLRDMYLNEHPEIPKE